MSSSGTSSSAPLRCRVAVRGHAGQKVAHLAPGATLGEALEEGSAGIHQRDHRRRERLAEDQRRRHRQRRDDVEPDLALPEAADDLDQQRRQDRDDARRPGDGGEVRPARRPQPEARHQAEERDAQEKLPAILKEWRHLACISRVRPRARGMRGFRRAVQPSFVDLQRAQFRPGAAGPSNPEKGLEQTRDRSPGSAAARRWRRRRCTARRRSACGVWPSGLVGDLEVAGLEVPRRIREGAREDERQLEPAVAVLGHRLTRRDRAASAGCRTAPDHSIACFAPKPSDRQRGPSCPTKPGSGAG